MILLVYTHHEGVDTSYALQKVGQPPDGRYILHYLFSTWGDALPCLRAPTLTFEDQMCNWGSRMRTIKADVTADYQTSEIRVVLTAESIEGWE